MASNEASVTKTILTRPEDWEKWFWQLQNNVADEIWPYIDPNGEEIPLLELPVRPQSPREGVQTRTAEEGQADSQKGYDRERQYFELDMKHYTLQRKQLKEARVAITSTVATIKQIHLNPAHSVRKWLQDLKADTMLMTGYMRTQARRRYHSTLKNFKPNKLSQWLDEWEASMVESIQHKVPETASGSGDWLCDLADLIRPMSDAFFLQLMKEADDDEKSDPQEFRTVARELREILARVPKSGRTQRGSGFHAGFGSEESPEDGSGNPTETEEASFTGKKGRKRAGTKTPIDPTSKKKVSECPACELRGYSLQDCWCIFEELRPEEMKSPSAYRVQKAMKKVDNNKKLKAQVEKLR
jgi:hypothetical protein